MTYKFTLLLVRRCLTSHQCAGTRFNFSRCAYRLNTADAAVEPQPISAPPLNGAKVYEPKIVNIVENISQLTLREVADLNELLKSTLNIKDIAVAAPIAQAGPSAGAADTEEEKAPERDEFAVKLISFSAADKIKLIKALKVAKPEFNLVQAKKFVESVPQMVIEAASKEDCEKMKKDLEEAGGKIEIV